MFAAAGGSAGSGGSSAALPPVGSVSELAYLNGITLQRSLSFQSTTPSPSSPNISVMLSVVADPRLHIARFQLPNILNAIDDQPKWMDEHG